MEIGFIGTGLMGLPMAQRLIDACLPVVAYNRTAAKLAPLQEAGVAVAPSAAATIAAADCVILMLTNAQAIREVVLGETARSALAGKTIIQMGTIAPAESQAIATEVTEAGGEYLEAPVLGSIPEARSGQLIVMVGGSQAQFDRWVDLLENFGPQPLYLGPVGAAAATKLALNQLIAALTTAFASSLGLVQHQGVDVEAFMGILRKSALYAPTFDKKLQRMVDRNYADPNFPTKHLLKDVKLFLEAGQAAGLRVDSVEGVEAILKQAIALNLADSDYSALYAAVNPE